MTRKSLSYAFAALLTVAAVGPAKDPPKAELVLKDVNGQRVRLSELRGKIVVLNFWATWCGPCKAELPLLVDAAKKYSPRGVVFIAASLDDAKSRSKVPEFVAAHGIDFPVWVGAGADDLDRLAMGPAVPATAILDAEGRIVARVWGQLREEELCERLDWLLGPRSDPAPPSLVKHLEK